MQSPAHSHHPNHRSVTSSPLRFKIERSFAPPCPCEKKKTLAPPSLPRTKGSRCWKYHHLIDYGAAALVLLNSVAMMFELEIEGRAAGEWALAGGQGLFPDEAANISILGGKLGSHMMRKLQVSGYLVGKSRSKCRFSLGGIFDLVRRSL